MERPRAISGLLTEYCERSMLDWFWVDLVFVHASQCGYHNWGVCTSITRLKVNLAFESHANGTPGHSAATCESICWPNKVMRTQGRGGDKTITVNARTDDELPEINGTGGRRQFRLVTQTLRRFTKKGQHQVNVEVFQGPGYQLKIVCQHYRLWAIWEHIPDSIAQVKAVSLKVEVLL
jgi:hypothetical protein